MGEFFGKRLYAMVLCLGLFTAILASPRQSQATLGESADSVAEDQNALSGVRLATTSRHDCTVHELGAGGTVVREYVSLSGIVFGIAWSGLTHPNLKPLLGAYWHEYEEALEHTSPKRGISRNDILKTDRLVVEKWGQMRNLQGRAYAPALIPPGVSIDEIK